MGMRMNSSNIFAHCCQWTYKYRLKFCSYNTAWPGLIEWKSWWASPLKKFEWPDWLHMQDDFHTNDTYRPVVNTFHQFKIRKDHGQAFPYKIIARCCRHTVTDISEWYQAKQVTATHSMTKHFTPSLVLRLRTHAPIVSLDQGHTPHLSRCCVHRTSHSIDVCTLRWTVIAILHPRLGMHVTKCVSVKPSYLPKDWMNTISKQTRCNLGKYLTAIHTTRVTDSRTVASKNQRGVNNYSAQTNSQDTLTHPQKASAPYLDRLQPIS